MEEAGEWAAEWVMSKERFHLFGGGVRAFELPPVGQGEPSRVGGWLPLRLAGGLTSRSRLPCAFLPAFSGALVRKGCGFTSWPLWMLLGEWERVGGPEPAGQWP